MLSHLFQFSLLAFGCCSKTSTGGLVITRLGDITRHTYTWEGLINDINLYSTTRVWRSRIEYIFNRYQCDDEVKPWLG